MKLSKELLKTLLSCVGALALIGCTEKTPAESASPEPKAAVEQFAEANMPDFEVRVQDVELIGGPTTFDRIGNNNRSMVILDGWLYMTPYAESPLLAYQLEEGEGGAVRASFKRAFEMPTRLGSGGLTKGPDNTVLFNTLGSVYQIKTTETVATYEP